MTEGYKALREGAALADLTGRGYVVLTGEDRARLLHAMCTQHVLEMTPGMTRYAFFLSSQGRILADAHLLCREDSFVLDTEPEAADALAAHLDKYIIADDCTVENRSAAHTVFAVEGPGARELLSNIASEDPPEPGRWIRWQAGMLAGIGATGQPGWRLFVDRSQAASVEGWLIGAGAITASAEEVRTVRIENGRPRFSVDFGERQIPQETQLLSAVHFSKGCYLGQEIVERVRSRGQVQRKLAHFTVDAATPPEPAAKLTFEGKEVGEITSAAASPRSGKSAAFGYLRTEVLDKKVAVRVSGALARSTANGPA